MYTLFLIDPKTTAGPAKKSTLNETGPEKPTIPVNTVMTRHLFDGEDQCYIINASLEGNVARFFNVSSDAAGIILCCQNRHFYFREVYKHSLNMAGHFILLFLFPLSYSIAVAPICSCRMSLWIHMTLGFPGWLFSQASKCLPVTWPTHTA